MDILSGIILGAVQGFTEFLPISSSGHLILARSVLGLQTETGLAVDAVLQLATALAVLIYFWRVFVDLAQTAFKMIALQPVEKQKRNLLLAVLIGTIPAVILGLLLEDVMETTFRSTTVVVGTLLVGGALMYAAELYKDHRQNEPLTWSRGLIIGLFQCLALVPGMSRSGSTIAGGLFIGLKRDRAARFSFLLSFPIIAGSGLKKLLDLGTGGLLTDMGGGLIAGFITAFVVGFGAIYFLMRYLRRHSLRAFVAYRVMLAALVAWLIYLQLVQ